MSSGDGFVKSGYWGCQRRKLWRPSQSGVFACKYRMHSVRRQEKWSGTNFMGKYIETEGELLAFAKTVGFPDHALILRSSKEGSGAIYKGIQTPEELSHYFKEISQQYGTVFAETDMRALYNPTRMKIIEQCTRKLIQTIRCFCPACGAPGFGVGTSLSGLPCKLCATPTRSVLGYVRNCRQCGHTEETMYPNGKKYEDPMFCDCCNP